MRRFLTRTSYIWAVLVAVAASGCGGTTTAPTPVTPAVTNVTEEFTGTLNVNGGATFPFVAGAAGLITATLTTLGPDSTLSVGLSLGTWNGTGCAVASIYNDNAGQGSAVIGQSTTTGSLCTRVYDVGKISEPIAYKITVVHP
jgi:hypothetical protein